MIIDEITNGIVLDHIRAGMCMDIYRILNLERLECSVAIIKNASSRKTGKKDIIKVADMFELDLDVLGYIEQSASIGYEYVQVFFFQYRGVEAVHIDNRCRNFPSAVFQRVTSDASHGTAVTASRVKCLKHKSRFIVFIRKSVGNSNSVKWELCTTIYRR